MIELSDIRFSYSTTDEVVLDGVNLSISPGEYILICGSNGSGKSTISYILNGLIPHFFEGRFEGNALINGKNTKTITPGELYPLIGLVLQNTDAYLFNGTVEEELIFSLESAGVPSAKIDSRIEKIVSLFFLEEILLRSPSTLSGGEKARVAIASTLITDPDIIILDEPFANLDEENIVIIRKFLKDANSRGCTVIIIEQILCDFINDSTRTIVFDKGKTVFDGYTPEVFPYLDKFHLIPRYREKPEIKNGEEILSVKNLTCKNGEKIILSDISFSLKRGEALAVLGRNGIGKTTLIKHLNGLSKAELGSIYICGRKVGEIPWTEMYRKVGVVFQNPNDQYMRIY